MSFGGARNAVQTNKFGGSRELGGEQAKEQKNTNIHLRTYVVNTMIFVLDHFGEKFGFPKKSLSLLFFIGNSQLRI